MVHTDVAPLPTLGWVVANLRLVPVQMYTEVTADAGLMVVAETGEPEFCAVAAVTVFVIVPAAVVVNVLLQVVDVPGAILAAARLQSNGLTGLPAFLVTV